MAGKAHKARPRTWPSPMNQNGMSAALYERGCERVPSCAACCPRASGPRSRRPAEQCDELAPLHSITSSARASRVGGTATLASIVAKAHPGIRFNEHVEGDGPTVFAHACKLGLEGIV